MGADHTLTAYYDGANERWVVMCDDCGRDGWVPDTVDNALWLAAYWHGRDEHAERIVDGAWTTASGEVMAKLAPVEGYTTASAPLDALRCACGGDLGKATGVCTSCGADCLGFYDDGVSF